MYKDELAIRRSCEIIYLKQGRKKVREEHTRDASHRSAIEADRIQTTNGKFPPLIVAKVLFLIEKGAQGDFPYTPPRFAVFEVLLYLQRSFLFRRLSGPICRALKIEFHSLEASAGD